MTEQTTATIVPFTTRASGLGTQDAEGTTGNLATSKLDDALTPGFQAEFSPEEAEVAGAFLEDSLSEADAFDSAPDARA